VTGRIVSIGTASQAGTVPRLHGRTRVPDFKIKNILVGLYSVSSVSRAARVPVDADGRWSAAVTSSGDYLIRFSAPGLVPTWYPQAVDAAQAIPVAVHGGTNALPPMMSGVALGSISVTLNIDGDADGAQVSVRLAGGTGMPDALVSTAEPTPAADGSSVFVAEHIPSPGSYVVVAEKDGYLTASLPVQLGLGEERSGDVLTLSPVPSPSASAPAPTTESP
jgi:hypothetical protein